ncbi:hypothetical protein CVO_01625 [Sulfurimonas sp. CVO]|jgi:hypothetical protein|uniref:Type IV pilus assembly protein PilN n=1 Tax=Sulfurimonas xiamenensis TaxID=2590021 RepID=A0AAJ4A4Q0_9BACT|nr:MULTISPECIES: hypothetical protein [Sulfurimonas]PLY13806.1 MAG: hypothetical protein C0628_05590 [Sulfurimonas sp.]QFR43848.1 hypothetical protein FJR47_07945 [Sulfurimonas xiamenensis]QHG90616.1 hypothetical protein CVO_01625 [Sulfurimonas sp. CVO]
MKYSYIKPRKKTIFTKDVQIISIFFGVTLFMLFATYAFLLFHDYRYEKEKVEIKKEKDAYHAYILKMDKKIEAVEKQNLLAEKIATKNSVLKESIHNLFDLVPDRITLSEAKIMEKGLILYGVTPNKDVYNFMLQAPLSSIFHRTHSTFYPADNGWLRFVSKNYIDEEELGSEN